MEILECIAWLLFDVFGEAFLDAGLASVSEALGLSRRRPVMATVGYVILGGIVGGVSVLLLSDRILHPVSVRGLSLILSPICCGVTMNWWGHRRQAHGHVTTNLATWYGGAGFAFGISLVRFLFVK